MFIYLKAKIPRIKHYGLDCIVCRVSQIWKTFPIEIRDSILLKMFKHKAVPCYCYKP